jgi:LmbE family N-acetylglucosaminyl deacetylase
VHRHRVLIVAAHPDDEVLGAGIWLHRHAEYDRHVLHITDGSPRDMQDARAKGFTTRQDYAQARRNELFAALQMIGIPRGNCHQCDYPDKDAYLHLPELVADVNAWIRELEPSLVVTSAYEGGHPDHDAAAFAVATVRRMLQSFRVLEFPLYHADARGQMVTAEFLHAPSSAGEAGLTLLGAERELKSHMVDCFVTQREILRVFSLDCEPLRWSPQYDFAEPPHAGPLLYELWGWGISGSEWRDRARRCSVTPRSFRA